MADISLRDYLGKLDTLLNKNAPGEVVHHCRHILQYFPKNAETYRYLGRALIQSSSWEDAGEVFQRVLSVYPDDYTAHLGLSDVYLHLKRPEDAIWHLERAFEQKPNDQSIIDGLRDLYRKHRRIEQAKIQLTAGAVARQYDRNGLYEQAIETLQQALERSPERADLRLLLAQTYHEAGYRVEAAEVALEVLKVLPDCLEANRILTELWLAESRPSDAQRYLNRIQSVEPYLALEIAQGGDVPDEAFRLEELDYRKAAEREINTQSPDWLRDIDSNTQPASASSPVVSDDPAWLESFAPSKAADEDDLPVFDDAFSSDLPNDWLSEVAPPAEPAVPRKKTGVTGLLNQLKVPETAPEPEPQAEEPDFESLFPTETTADELFPADDTALPQTEEPLPDLPDLFADAPSETAHAAPVRQTGALKETDPLAWLHESGIEIVENAEQPLSDDLFDADEDNLALQDVDAADPMAWLQGYGGDMINEDAPAARGSMIQEEAALPSASSDDEDNPLAWLQGSGVEITEEPAAPPSYTPQVEESDPLDWLADESMLDEALDLEALIDAPTTSTASTSPITASETNNWQSAIPEPEIQDDELDWLNASEPAAEAPLSINDDVVRMESTTEGEPLPDWFAGMAEEEPAPSTSEVPDWLSEMSPGETAEPEAESAGSGMLNWLSSEEPDEDTVSDFTPAAVSADEDRSASWMPDASDEEDSLSETGVEAMPDWFSQAAPDQEYVPETPSASGMDEASFGMMSEADADESSTSETGVEAMPDWLSQTTPTEAPDFESASPDAEDEGFAWMSAGDAEPDATAEAEAEVPDWLSELPSIEDEESEHATTVQMSVQSTPDNLTLIEGIGPKTAAALEASGITTFKQIADTSADDLYQIVVVEQGVALVGDPENWPKQAQFLVDGDINGFHAYKDYLVGGREPVEDISAPENEVMSAPTSDESGFEWMSEMPNDETPETTPASDDSGFEWMSDASNTGDAQAESTADTPDWLSQIAPASEESAEPEDAADDSGFQWMSDVKSEETDAEPAGVPDWLSQMAPADDEDPEPEITSTAPAAEESGFEWISEVNADEPEAVADTPDWLSQMAPADDEEAEVEPASTAPAAEDSGFEWISEVNADEPEAEPAIETPDWLSQMAPADDEEAEPAVAAPTAEASGFDWISEVDADNDAEAEPAVDTPDWLSQMAPADDQDAEPAVATPTAEASGFDWISEVNADDDAEAEPAVDTPDWLSQIAPADDEEAEPVADTPDWLSQMAPADDDEEAEPEASGNVPDWLAQVKPVTTQTTTLEDPNAEFAWEDSLDSDQDEEAESSESAPEWLSNIQSSQSNTPDEPIEEPVGAGFSWIDDMQDKPDESAVPEANQATARTFGPDDFGDAVEDEVAAAPEPASNAPDWLNAMVPGLDVDYDAPEDEPLEESYVEDPSASAEKIAPIQNKREFDWLMNIVEEETQQVRAITDSGKQRRFVFSRQPAWLRQPTEVNEKSNSTPAETQDDDFDDVDLPPWLQ